MFNNQNSVGNWGKENTPDSSTAVEPYHEEPVAVGREATEPQNQRGQVNQNKNKNKRGQSLQSGQTLNAPICCWVSFVSFH